jgi:hypothetical protein
MREVDECGRLVRSESTQQQTLNPTVPTFQWDLCPRVQRRAGAAALA